jgi:hypothetical protein
MQEYSLGGEVSDAAGSRHAGVTTFFQGFAIAKTIAITGNRDCNQKVVIADCNHQLPHQPECSD